MDTLKRMEELIREGKGHTLAMAVMKLAEPHFTTITDHPYEFEMFKQWSKAYADIVCRGWDIPILRWPPGLGVTLTDWSHER